MFKHRIIWDDFNGQTHQEDFYFNMLVPEFADLEFHPEFGGSFSEYIRQGMKSGEGQKIYMIFKLLVVHSYGRRSEDGQYFRKNTEWTNDFLESPAWEQFFLWLTDETKGHSNAGSFWEGVFPEALKQQAAALEEANTEKKDISEMSREELERLVNKVRANKVG